jgi:hypothetical protein
MNSARDDPAKCHSRQFARALVRSCFEGDWPDLRVLSASEAPTDGTALGEIHATVARTRQSGHLILGLLGLRAAATAFDVIVLPPIVAVVLASLDNRTRRLDRPTNPPMNE